MLFRSAQGESSRAQQVLEDAIKLSPLAIRRQMELGKLALENQDFASASRAYRHAMEQGRTSIFKSPDNYLGLAQALTAQGIHDAVAGSMKNAGYDAATDSITPESSESSEKYSKVRPENAERWMFMAGAYQPATCMS